MPGLTYWLPSSAPTMWLHITKPHVMGRLVGACFGEAPPAGLVLSESWDDPDAATLRPLLGWLAGPVALAIIADLDAEGVRQALATVGAARGQGRQARVIGIGDGVLGDADSAALALTTLEQEPADAPLLAAAAACDGGCWGTVSLDRLATGRTIELEGVLHPAAEALRGRLVAAVRAAVEEA